MSREEKIKEFEEELTKTKYHKGTQHHVGLVKAKIARLKEEIETKRKGKGKTEGFVLKKTGDATVVLVGFPSVGKSTLLNRITNADSKVAEYEFTTLTVIPGMLEYKNAKIQIFDVPGIVGGAAEGTGRGKEVLAAIRSADMIMILLDINQMHHYKIVQKELYDSGFRLNKKKPDVRIKRTSKGGISINSTVPLDIDKKTFEGILNEFKVTNADVLIRTIINDDELIDVVEDNKRYLPGLVLINKTDTVSQEKLRETKSKYPEAIFISAELGLNLGELKEKIFNSLKMIRIYLKQPGIEADMKEPMIMREGNRLNELCIKLHRDFVKKFRFARIWGSVKYDGQKVTRLTHNLLDGDIVELHLR
ncbi:MAG: GTP-binding protein [Nanoarchaeota archaeon]